MEDKIDTAAVALIERLEATIDGLERIGTHRQKAQARTLKGIERQQAERKEAERRKAHRRRMADIFYNRIPAGALCDGKPEFVSRPSHEGSLPITASYSRAHADEFKSQLAACHRCQIQDECLDIALRFGEEYGIYGGLLPHERLDME